MNIVSYIRVSGKSQIEGNGPERQRDSIAAFCLTHKLVQLGEFFEKGVSGIVEGLDRPAFSEMLEFIGDQKGEVQAIVVERLDRLSRDLMVGEILLSECRKRGIKVFAADQGQLIDMAENGGDPTRVLIRQIMGALAQWEKTMLVQKLAKARARVKAKTGRCGGVHPYGSFPGEAQLIKWAELSREPGQTLQQLADSLNSAGFTTRNGKQWKRQNVHNILKYTKGTK
jgi:DNA invertase Pin-like site-specific DNA recombinase